MDGQGQPPELVLYDSKDLTTHAVIIGMTGSGKTGLGVALLEEALLDKIPVIAIDPKGDLTNLALTFPGMQAEDLKPWVNPQEALAKGKTVDAYAVDEARKWTEGLAQWGQDTERITRLKNAAELKIYTPGSSAGASVSLLRKFSAPPDVGAERSGSFQRTHRNHHQQPDGPAGPGCGPYFQPGTYPGGQYLQPCLAGRAGARSGRLDPGDSETRLSSGSAL